MHATNPQPQRGGFTMIEMTFVVVTLAILIGILLPAVQAAREGARRMQCDAQLTQLHLAVSSYHGAHRVLPPGTFSASLPVANYPNGYHHGWLVRILPWLDQSVVYREIDFRQSVYRPVNQFLFHRRPDVVGCPSAPYFYESPPSSQYAAAYDGRRVPIDADSRGAFIANQLYELDEIEDGLSRTLFASEKFTRSYDLGWPSGTTATLRTTGIPLSESNSKAARNASAYGSTVGSGEPYGWFKPLEREDGRSSASDPAGTDERTAEEGAAASQEIGLGTTTGSRKLVQFTQLYGSLDDVAEDSAGFPPAAPKSEWYAPAGFGSFHHRGINVVMLDGSTRFVTNSIDVNVYAALGMRDDAAPLSNVR